MRSMPLFMIKKIISSRQTVGENGPKILARWSVKIFSITGTSDNTSKMREKTSLKETNFDQIVFRFFSSFFLSLSSTRRQGLVHLPKSSTVTLVRQGSKHDMEFMPWVFTHMPGENYCGKTRLQ